MVELRYFGGLTEEEIVAALKISPRTVRRDWDLAKAWLLRELSHTIGEAIGTLDMTPERFRQIEELYHAAREGTADERAALLAQADPELRREVESLLAQPTGGEFLDRPAIQNAPELLEDSTVTGLASGACLGPYRIESKLGEGGMGEVFRAIDTRLGRAVAIKITREQFSARFEREARAISSLNHPNICTLHDVGPNYLVMELVEGETLAARLKSGPLPIEDGAPLRRPDRGRAGGGARQGHHSPRSEARQHHDRRSPASRFWISDWRRSDGDETLTAEPHGDGHARLHGAGAAGRQTGGCPHGYLRIRLVLYEMLTGDASRRPQRRRIRPRKLETIVSRCLEEDPGTTVAIRCRVAAGIGGGHADEAGARWAVTPRFWRWRRDVLLPSPGAETHREGHDRAGRIRKQDRRSGV